MDHPIAPESLENFLRGRASREEARRIVAHLLTGCPSCAERLTRRQEPAPNAYDAALDRFADALLHGQAPEKLDLPPPIGVDFSLPARQGRLSLSKL